MIFILLALSIILLVALASICFVMFASEEGLTFNDLDRSFFLDRGYITLASRAAWNDPD